MPPSATSRVRKDDDAGVFRDDPSMGTGEPGSTFENRGSSPSPQATAPSPATVSPTTLGVRGIAVTAAPGSRIPKAKGEPPADPSADPAPIPPRTLRAIPPPREAREDLSPPRVVGPRPRRPRQPSRRRHRRPSRLSRPRRPPSDPPVPHRRGHARTPRTPRVSFSSARRLGECSTGFVSRRPTTLPTLTRWSSTFWRAKKLCLENRRPR